MKRTKKTRLILALAVLVLIFAGWYVWYTWPKPFEDVCRDAGWETLSAENAVLNGDYHFYEENEEAGSAPVHYVISMEELPAGDDGFAEMLTILQELQFGKTLFPSKTRTHPIQAGDRAIYLSFSSPDLPPLRVTFWFDELYIACDGKEFVAPKSFEAAAKQVAEFILARGGEKEQFE